jgi:hypothetical protein
MCNGSNNGNVILVDNQLDAQIRNCASSWLLYEDAQSEKYRKWKRDPAKNFVMCFGLYRQN